MQRITETFWGWELPLCINLMYRTACRDTSPFFLGWVTCRSSPWLGCRSRWRHWTGCGHTAASAAEPRVPDRPDTLQRRGIALTQPGWCVHVMTGGKSTVMLNDRTGTIGLMILQSLLARFHLSIFILTTRWITTPSLKFTVQDPECKVKNHVCNSKVDNNGLNDR